MARARDPRLRSGPRRTLAARLGHLALVLGIALGVSLFVDLRTGLLRYHVPLALVLGIDVAIATVVFCLYEFVIRRDLERAPRSRARSRRGSPRSRH